MSYLKVYTVFLPVQQRKMLKKFKKVTDPSSKDSHNFEKMDYFDSRWESAARTYFRAFQGATLRKTIFPGVLRLVTTKQELKRYLVPLFYRIKEEKYFDEIEATIKGVDATKDIITLDGTFEASRKFKKRINLYLMDLAIQGKTVLAPVKSSYSEMPAITAYNREGTPFFSGHFKRKKYAFYQDFLVQNYLLDPLNITKLKSLQDPLQGRAIPDITLRNPQKFVKCLEEINEKRKVQNLPPIGFINPILYNNAKIFMRNLDDSLCHFPESVTLWKPHVGLGEPEIDRFQSLFFSS